MSLNFLNKGEARFLVLAVGCSEEPDTDGRRPEIGTPARQYAPIGVLAAGVPKPQKEGEMQEHDQR